MNAHDLVKQGFVTIPYPTSLRTVVEEAMNSWQRFCGLEDETKRLFSGGDRINDFGYMRRQDTGQTADNKELFHASGKDMAVLLAQTHEVGDPRATQFIHATGTLINEIRRLVIAFGTFVEFQHGVVGLGQAVENSADRWVFRFLHYFPGEIFAQPHADRGGFTLHLYESAPGGEYLDFKKRWQPWPVSREETIIFPSMVLQRRSDSRLKALWHRVVAQVSTDRYSMVAFIDFDDEYEYDHRKKRLQDFEPGFNYGGDPAEFQKLFVRREQP